MVANELKFQIAVSMQLQRALNDPSREIRILSSKPFGHFQKNKIKSFNKINVYAF